MSPRWLTAISIQVHTIEVKRTKSKGLKDQEDNTKSEVVAPGDGREPEAIRRAAEPQRVEPGATPI